ncbi:hypothetical protein TrVE_jg7185 [Triparma verrucosa]|uniref:Uncharacterized protein n=1 Tax=Triparma verrucosa TaxID=1606542 RepID=A0A9W7F3F2_9STRA|nr:hypothetical protein TrVE_jg7185 [Triparma verrucosa]
MKKPLICLSLESLGFTADFKKFPVYLNRGERGVTTMVHENHVIDLRPQFPYTVCRAQGLSLVKERGEGARRVHVLSEFTPPEVGGGRIEERLEGEDFTLYSARIVAFISTVENARKPMFEYASKEMGGYEYANDATDATDGTDATDASALPFGGMSCGAFKMQQLAGGEQQRRIAAFLAEKAESEGGANK